MTVRGRSKTGISIGHLGRSIIQLLIQDSDASDWAKITSKAKNGIETHAYKNVKTGEIVEYKTKAVVTTSK